MTPHTHALHALRADASPTLRLCMACTDHDHVRMFNAARQLDASLDAGEWDRVNCDRKRDLRGLVWFLDEMAERARERAETPPRVARKWWKFWR